VYILQKERILQSGTLANAGRPERVKNKQTKTAMALFQTTNNCLLKLSMKDIFLQDPPPVTSHETQNPPRYLTLLYTGCPTTHGIIKTRWGGHLTTT
jgi:hypothetical protein